MKGVSVVICCYNSSTRITPTLQHLLKQEDINPDSWEIILIDNASKDDTAAIANGIYNGYPGTKPTFKIVKEEKPGLSSARVRGIEESTYQYILFCDDDNWLDSHYLSLALNIMDSDERIGILGGMGEPVFEKSEPPFFWVNQYHALAVGPQYKETGDITSSRGVVYGAGMVLNKKAFTRLIQQFDFTFQASDRIGTSLVSCGDHELCMAIRMIGYKIFWTEKLVFKHFMPSTRTTIDYYKKLFKGYGLSIPMLIGYSLKKSDYNNFKTDYKYRITRYIKNIFVSSLKLLFLGYPFAKNKYKYMHKVQGLYANIGALEMTAKTKNYYRDKFIRTKLFTLITKAANPDIKN